MTGLQGFAIAGSAVLGLPQLFGRPEGPLATVVLSHRYFMPNELRDRALDRLRRQLDWLRSAYRPISVSELLQNLAVGRLPDRAIVVTTDDALLDVYEVANEFRNFEVPLAVYVCVGWVVNEEKSARDWLSYAISAIQWYDGPNCRIELTNGSSFDLSAAKKAANIDQILSEQDLLAPHLEELCSKVKAPAGPTLRRSLCNWSELCELASSGVHIGAHSVSHVPISRMSPVRQRFEILESKRILEANIGTCTSFAYPYGTRDTHDRSTLAQVKDAGFKGAFLACSDFVTLSSHNFELPRITLPDAPISLNEFKARVAGGGIPLQRLRQLVQNPPYSGESHFFSSTKRL
jgi:peptidoglycan/xylan/chitin deacetylase (PgdA/CDA1 family)